MDNEFFSADSLVLIFLFSISEIDACLSERLTATSTHNVQKSHANHQTTNNVIHCLEVCFLDKQTTK